MNDIKALEQTAMRAANEGRWQEAERAWRKMLALEPKHPRALCGMGMYAFQRGQLDEALQSLQQAHAAQPRDPVVLLWIARVERKRGRVQAERAAIDAALAADPYFLPALLVRAELLEQAGQAGDAVTVYRNALKIAPAEAQWPPVLRPQLQHAQALVKRYGEEISAYLAEATGSRMQSLSAFEAGRWREAGALLAGTSQPYPSICHQLQVPRLPAIPFFDPAQFPWVEELEAQTEAITEELRAVMAEDEAGFSPYVTHAPGTPLNQWRELNHSPRWSSYRLWDAGRPVEEHMARCPRTTAALRRIDRAEIDGNCPNAMFSALAPHTQIPPHTGDTNARLVVHLPLIVPEGCSYRVGFEQRNWEVGKVLIFDDTIEHEARNDSDELRVVLIFDIWNPLLSQEERELVRCLDKAKREFEFNA